MKINKILTENKLREADDELLVKPDDVIINTDGSSTEVAYEVQDAIKTQTDGKAELSDVDASKVAAEVKDAAVDINAGQAVVIPKDKDSFIDEANQQHNCVFRMYYPKVRDNRAYIVFVRKVDSPTKSYITCEINKQGEIVQYLRKYNNTIESKEDIDFKNEYQKHLLENWK